MVYLLTDIDNDNDDDDAKEINYEFVRFTSSLIEFIL